MNTLKMAANATKPETVSCGPMSGKCPRAQGSELCLQDLPKRVIALDKDDAVELTTCGWSLAYVVRDFEQGAALIDRALVLNSNSAEAWHCGGRIKDWLGAPVPAIECFARAKRTFSRASAWCAPRQP